MARLFDDPILANSARDRLANAAHQVVTDVVASLDLISQEQGKKAT